MNVLAFVRLRVLSWNLEGARNQGGILYIASKGYCPSRTGTESSRIYGAFVSICGYTQEICLGFWVPLQRLLEPELRLVLKPSIPSIDGQHLAPVCYGETMSNRCKLWDVGNINWFKIFFIIRRDAQIHIVRKVTTPQHPVITFDLGSFTSLEASCCLLC